MISQLILNQMADEERARDKRIKTAWDRYNGDHPKPLAPSTLDPKAQDNTCVNLARRTVDISAYYLFGREITFEVDGQEKSEADTWLEECWAANGKMPRLLEFATGAGVAGDGFLRVIAPGTGETFPRIVCLDAQHVTASWDPADYERVIQYKIQFTGVDPERREAVTYRHLFNRLAGNAWEITEQEARGNSTTFKTTDGPTRWPWPFCPIFHTKNRPFPHSFYGGSDVEADVLVLNDAINFVLSNINRILRAHGHPFTYGTGTGPDKIDRAVGGILWLPNPSATIQNVEMLSDLTSSQDQLKRLQEAYREMTSIPEIAAGKLESIGQLSGLALQILYGPLVALTNVKRMFYGAMLVELCKALLVMGGQGEAHAVKIQWPSLLPEDRQEEANTAVALQAAGVSKGTTLAELGYDPEIERRKRANEAKDIADLALTKFDRGEEGDA